MNAITEKTNLILAAIFILFGLNAFGQGTADWSKYRSANGKLVFSLPHPDVVISVDGRVELYSYTNEAQLIINKLKAEDPKDFVRSLDPDPGPDEQLSVKTIQISNYLVKKIIREKKGSHKISFYIASGSDYFFVGAFAKRQDDPDVTKFLASVGIAGQSILEPTEAREPSGTRIEDLETSPNANDTLRKVCRNDVPIAYDNESLLKKEPVPQPRYSRNAVVVGWPHPDLLEVPRRIKMSNRKVVVLRVILQADGCVGPIVVIEGAKDRETYAALMAAVRTRFLPARIDSKSTDSVTTLMYGFGE